MGKIDLHFHSFYSDGIYSPQELVKQLKENNFKTAVLTDHNTIKGVEEFIEAGEKTGLKVFTGVEIYTRYKGESLHILGYNFDLKNKELNSVLKELQEQKRDIVKKAIKILQKDDWQIKEEDVFKYPSSYLGVFHLAGALKENFKNWQRIKKDFQWTKGKIILINEIISQYLIKDKKNICPETEINTEQAIQLIKNAGGKAVLAHPGQQLPWRKFYLIKELKEIGLQGLEAVSSHHSWDDIVFWQKIAKENDLFITAGSDFHGDVPEEWAFMVRSQRDYFIPKPQNWLWK